jgi:LAO/AO transport system kinase
VLELATVRMRRKLDATAREDDEVHALLEQVVERKLDPASAAAQLLDRLT